MVHRPPRLTKQNQKPFSIILVLSNSKPISTIKMNNGHHSPQGLWVVLPYITGVLSKYAPYLQA
jgi:hypothetical protein